MLTPNNTSNEFDDRVPLAIRVVSDGRSNSVLHSAPPVSNDIQNLLARPGKVSYLSRRAARMEMRPQYITSQLLQSAAENLLH